MSPNQKLRLPRHFTTHSIPLADADAEGNEVAHVAHLSCWCHPVPDPEAPKLWRHNALDARERFERQDIPTGKHWVAITTLSARDHERNTIEAGGIKAAYAISKTLATAAAFGITDRIHAAPYKPCSFLTEEHGEVALHYLCPACRVSHIVPVTGEGAHVWNGSIDAPTLAPSMIFDSPNSKGEFRTCHHQLINGWVRPEPGTEFPTVDDGAQLDTFPL